MQKAKITKTEMYVYLTLLAWLGSALASKSNATTDAWPPMAAFNRAVSPSCRDNYRVRYDILIWWYVLKHANDLQHRRDPRRRRHWAVMSLLVYDHQQQPWTVVSDQADAVYNETKEIAGQKILSCPTKKQNYAFGVI